MTADMPTPKTKRELFDRIVKELCLDVDDGFTRLLANAFAIQERKELLEIELAQAQQALDETNCPRKYVRHGAIIYCLYGAIIYCLYGTSSICAYEDLQAQIEKARKDTGWRLL